MQNSPENQSRFLDNLYQSVLGRAADQAGKTFWMNALQNGTSMAEVTKDFYNSPEYTGIPSFDVGTNDVPNDMLAKIHKGERIIPAADNAELKQRLKDGASDTKVDTSALEAKIDDLIEVMQTGDVANVQKTNELFKIVREWNLNGMPPERQDK
jgi:hypothetical protein